jgi:hypothetical protein
VSAAVGTGRIRATEAKTRHALPAALPAGERVLWRGEPDWRAIARHALHLRGLGLYLAIIVAWVGFAAAHRGEPASAIAWETTRAALVASVPLLVGLGYAWLAARTAAYTITNRRVVIRMGLVVPLTLNLPFTRIDGAALTSRRDGTGDIALALAPGSAGLGWFIMWPHTRPWHLAKAQPLLRGLHDAARAGQILARALSESASMPVVVASATGIVDSDECHHGTTTVAA